MGVLLLAQFLFTLAAAAPYELVSFTSPLYPIHSRKFYMLGSAIPFKEKVRVIPNIPRKTGSLVAINPIREVELSVVVKGSFNGELRHGMDGGFTLWFTSTYARHITVGDFFGVNSKIVGFLVVYDFNQGLIGLDKTTNDPLEAEHIPTTYICKPNYITTFQVNVKITEGKASVSTSLGGQSEEQHCFDMPITTASERYAGFSAHCGHNCVRGVDLYSIEAEIAGKDNELLDKIYKDDMAMEEKLKQASLDLEGIATYSHSTYSEEELKAVGEEVTALKSHLQQLLKRIENLESLFSEAMAAEASDNSSPIFYNTLKETLSTLEQKADELLAEARKTDIGVTVSKYMIKNSQMLINERQIDSLARVVEKKTRDFQTILNSDDDFTLVYAAFAIAVLFCFLLYYSTRIAAKNYDV